MSRSMRRLAERASYWLARTLRARRGQDQPAFAVSVPEAVTSGADATDLGRTLFKLTSQPVFKWTHYLPAYEAEFGPLRGRPIRMLEIGVYKGGSLQLWREYFGPDATIYGIDIDPGCAQVQAEGIEVRIGSQDDPEFLARVVAEMGGIDIVLDDGSHVGRHQRTSFETLFPLLADGGIYAVEDLHTAYWRDYGGGYRKGESFIEVIKMLIDDMHSWYHSKEQSTSVDAARTIPKIAFYDSVAFMHKAAKHRPTNFITG
jgi:Methyltransferase domain